MWMTKICEGCSETFELSPGKNGKINKKQRFYTRTCHMKWYNVKGAAHAIKGGQAGGKAVIAKYRGTGTRTYVKENQRHQHRVVAEQMLGRALLPGEIVHHKDGNKKNNSPDNLKVMTQSEHVSLHARETQAKRRVKHEY